jgi:2,4-dienoyl-CoA reductase-like NADH-dependent reductase (Old Yellow Enzyme family)/thioredoxin reductase
MELRNRIVYPPMVTQYADEQGFITDRSRSYYEARARGGAGLVIIEATYVHPRGQAFAQQISISDDKFIPGLTSLTGAIHRHGARAAIQLHHGGRMAKSKLMGMKPLAPSPIPALGNEVPQELTIDEIKELVLIFASAALRAKQAGFDGVEIHGAHGYLLHQFLSLSTNRRQDEYGGSIASRSKFLLEVIEVVRGAVGKDYPVWCRVTAKEYGVTDGTTLEEAQETARMAQAAGIDAIHVSASGPAGPNILTSPVFVPGVISHLVEGIKKVVRIPVIAVGKLTLEFAERLLKEGKTDLVAMGRQLLADPDLPNKIAAGKLDEINPCTDCFNCRSDLLTPGVLGIRCQVNPAAGRETEFEILKTKKSRKVLVIGGGPAGMTAARVAAARGHKVTLWEKTQRLGGQLIQAAIPPHKGRIGLLNQYLQSQLDKAGVKVQDGKVFAAKDVARFKPDVVVMATGVKPVLPDIPGLSKARFALAGDVLEGKVAVGEKVIVIGGETVGCETAEFLADRGKKVTVTRRGSDMATGVGVSLRAFFLGRLREKGVTLLTSVKYEEITADGLVLTMKDGEKTTIPADTYVLAAGSVPDLSLYEEIKGAVPDIQFIGDCLQPRSIRDAISDGFKVGMKL